MIIDVSAQNTPVLYASSGVDITQDIIALYDKTSTNGGPEVLPGAAVPGTPIKPAPRRPRLPANNVWPKPLLNGRGSVALVFTAAL